MNEGKTKFWLSLVSVILVVHLILDVVGAIKVKQVMAGMAMGKKMAPAPPGVSTIVVKPQQWQPVLSTVGSLKAVNGVVVSTDLAGVVSEIAFDSGAQTKKGDLLLKLDARQEIAQLAQAQAKLDLSKVNLTRQQDLLQKKAIAQSDYDAVASDYRQNEAAVENAKALIARKTITASFDGLLGIRQVNVGQYINVGDPIVPLQSLDPIYVDFALPQQQLDQVAVGKKIRIKASGVETKEFEGTITSINSLVDQATRNITVEATVTNQEGKLRPGMFVAVEVILPDQDGVLTIPSSAISYAPYGDSVFLIKKGKDDEGNPATIVENHVVKTGPTRGDQVAILSGLKEGDEVVTSGVFKLQGGKPVQVNNEVQPADEAHPKPPDS